MVLDHTKKPEIITTFEATVFVCLGLKEDDSELE